MRALDIPLRGGSILAGVPATLGIGDFARATHLTVKTLRHYHRIGLLEPTEVDAETGYRRYSSDQIRDALIIVRFRALDMPLDAIGKVLSATDLDARNAVIAAHLERLEAALEHTRSAAESLRELLGSSPRRATVPVEHLALGATSAAAITAVIDFASGGAGPWMRGAMAEIGAALAAQGLATAGPPGGMFADEVFSEGSGEATVFMPVTGPFLSMGRTQAITIPAVELAIVSHAGGHADIDRAYGALGTYVSEAALSVPGPVREYYLSGFLDTQDEHEWRTQIGWPIFRTTP